MIKVMNIALKLHQRVQSLTWFILHPLLVWSKFIWSYMLIGRRSANISSSEHNSLAGIDSLIYSHQLHANSQLVELIAILLYIRMIKTLFQLNLKYLLIMHGISRVFNQEKPSKPGFLNKPRLLQNSKLL